MRFHNGSDKGTASNFVQILEKVQQRPWQWLDKCSAFEWHARFKADKKKKGETGEEQSQEHDIIFFDIKEIVHKEFVLAGQTDNYTYYCGVLQWMREHVQRLHPERLQ
jgi:hypothetical protein